MRVPLCLCLGSALSLAPAALAQHGPQHEPSPIWLWANFAILAGALGYVISRKAGPFFRLRGRQIQQGIADAAKLKAEAEAKAADIERRMAGLATDIASLRARASEEIAAEAERLSRETRQTAAKIQAQAQQEIAASVKAARQELKACAAKLALDLAEQQIRAELTPAVDAALLHAFVEDLERQPREGRV